MKTIIITLLLLLTTTVQAEQSFGVHLNGLSKHINASREYNEENYGAGIYYEVNKHFIAAGWYDNSFDKTSKYITTGWRHAFRSGNWEVSPGIMVGGITGYTDEGSKFVAAPLLSVGYQPVKVNLTLLPGINGFDAVWFAQLEIKLWGKK